MKYTTITVFIALFLLSCNVHNDGNQTERIKLTYAKEKWENSLKSNVLGYVFSSKSECYCAFTNKVRIGVKNDSINSVIEISNQNAFSDSNFIYFKTINEWFNWISMSIDEQPYYLNVEYDETLGYPKYINYDGKREIADDEFIQTNDSLSLIYITAM